MDDEPHSTLGGEVAGQTRCRPQKSDDARDGARGGGDLQRKGRDRDGSATRCGGCGVATVVPAACAGGEVAGPEVNGEGSAAPPVARGGGARRSTRLVQIVLRVLSGCVIVTGL